MSVPEHLVERLHDPRSYIVDGTSRALYVGCYPKGTSTRVIIKRQSLNGTAFEVNQFRQEAELMMGVLAPHEHITFTSPLMNSIVSFSPNAIRSVQRQVLKALAFAHGCGVIQT